MSKPVGKQWNGPRTVAELEADGYRLGNGRGRCRECGAPIRWAKTHLGNPMPMSEITRGRFDPHHAVCPKKKKGKRK